MTHLEVKEVPAVADWENKAHRTWFSAGELVLQEWHCCHHGGPRLIAKLSLQGAMSFLRPTIQIKVIASPYKTRLTHCVVCLVIYYTKKL